MYRYCIEILPRYKIVKDPKRSMEHNSSNKTKKLPLENNAWRERNSNFHFPFSRHILAWIPRRPRINHFNRDGIPKATATVRFPSAPTRLGLACPRIIKHARVNAFRGEESPRHYVHGRSTTMVAPSFLVALFEGVARWHETSSTRFAVSCLTQSPFWTINLILEQKFLSPSTIQSSLLLTDNKREYKEQRNLR